MIIIGKKISCLLDILKTPRLKVRLTLQEEVRIFPYNEEEVEQRNLSIVFPVQPYSTNKTHSTIQEHGCDNDDLFSSIYMLTKEVLQ